MFGTVRGWAVMTTVQNELMHVRIRRFLNGIPPGIIRVLY